MTRTGKIARLPREIRDDLNRRLERNIPGITLVDWLNSLPGVQEVLDNLFEGKPISPQNLSEWRHGGFAEWQAENDFLERLSDLAFSSETIEATCGHMADHAARVLSARMALIIANPSSSDDALASLKHLTPLVRNLTLLRRADHSAARLKLAQQAFDQTRKDRAHRPPPASPFPEATRTQSNQIKPLIFTPTGPGPIPRSESQPKGNAVAHQYTHGSAGTWTQSNLIKLQNTPAANQGANGSPVTNAQSNPITPLNSSPVNPEFSSAEETRLEGSLTVEQGTNATPETRIQSNLIKPQNSTPAEPVLKCGPEAQREISRAVQRGTGGTPGKRSPEYPMSPGGATETSPTALPPPFPTAIVTQPNVTISPKTAPDAPSTDPAPVSETDLWQMRHRALPSDPPPAWRIQLPIKTVLPLWLTPLSYKVTPPTRARIAR